MVSICLLKCLILLFKIVSRLFGMPLGFVLFLIFNHPDKSCKQVKVGNCSNDQLDQIDRKDIYHHLRAWREKHGQSCKNLSFFSNRVD